MVSFFRLIKSISYKFRTIRTITLYKITHIFFYMPGGMQILHTMHVCIEKL